MCLYKPYASSLRICKYVFFDLFISKTYIPYFYYYFFKAYKHFFFFWQKGKINCMKKGNNCNFNKTKKQYKNKYKKNKQYVIQNKL